MATQPSFEDIIGCQTALFEWAESYDSKDWVRLSKCVAPTLRIDYRAFLNKLWEAMPADAFVVMASDPKVLGNPLLKTQHLVGVSVWSKTSPTEITGYHQMRVAHQRYADNGDGSMTTVAATAHAHGKGTVWYRKVDGVWKFAGIEPDIRWDEGDHHRIFADGEEKFGDGGSADGDTDGQQLDGKNGILGGGGAKNGHAVKGKGKA